MALLFPRPGELRAAEWGEFDLERAVWTVPAARTKMRRPHRVPLARQVLHLLATLRPLSGKSTLVFPDVRSPSRPISHIAQHTKCCSAALRRLGYATHEATAHGFRASASSLLNESGHWHPDAIERQLGHLEGNEVRAAYARGEHWDERVSMIQWWANEIERLKQHPVSGL